MPCPSPSTRTRSHLLHSALRAFASQARTHPVLRQPAATQQHTAPQHKDLRSTPGRPSGPTASDAARPAKRVRLTDEPERPGCGARAYLIERCVEADPRADGTSPLAHMNAIVADYIAQAQRLQRCPLDRASLLTETRATTVLAPKASKDSPFEVMVRFGVATWPDAIAARAASRREVKALAAAVAA